jgi:hypothetical protein
MSVADQVESVPMEVDEPVDPVEPVETVKVDKIKVPSRGSVCSGNIISEGRRSRRATQRYIHPDQDTVDRKGGFDEETFEEAYRSDTEIQEEDEEEADVDDDEEEEEEIVDGEYCPSDEESSDDEVIDDDIDAAAYILMYRHDTLGVYYEALDADGMVIDSVHDLPNRNNVIESMLRQIGAETVAVCDKPENMLDIVDHLVATSKADDEIVAWTDEQTAKFVREAKLPSDLPDFETVHSLFTVEITST